MMLVMKIMGIVIADNSSIVLGVNHVVEIWALVQLNR